MPFSIFTDSSANLTKETLAALNVLVISLTYEVNGEEHLCYDPNAEFDGDLFYTKLKNPDFHVHTSMINSERFRNAFEQELSADRDVLYIAMSSMISGTYQAAMSAREELLSVYPMRKISVVDTRAASLGEGLIVCHAALMREDIRRWLYERHYPVLDDRVVLDAGRYYQIFSVGQPEAQKQSLPEDWPEDCFLLGYTAFLRREPLMKSLAERMLATTQRKRKTQHAEALDCLAAQLGQILRNWGSRA